MYKAMKTTGRLHKLKAGLRNYELYLFLAPALLYFIIFHYWPMYGVVIAFKDFTPTLGFMGSPWVGMEHFERFANSFHFWTLIKNTIGISLYQLAVSFPVPIILALMINELNGKRFKKLVQTVTYAPHFISTVVMVGMLFLFLGPVTGIVNQFISLLGGDPIDFMGSPQWFKSVFVLSDVWQNAGWGSIIYLSALAGIDPQMKEAALIDGATRLQRIRYINIPTILPVIIILLILNFGGMMNVGFEKIFLMQNALNMSSSDVISTYVYRSGLIGAEFSFSTAVGLFNSVINFLLLVLVNYTAKRAGNTSLW